MKLTDLRNQNPFRVIIGHINVNSIRDKFEPLVSFINNNLVIFLYQRLRLMKSSQTHNF